MQKKELYNRFKYIPFDYNEQDYYHDSILDIYENFLSSNPTSYNNLPAGHYFIRVGNGRLDEYLFIGNHWYKLHSKKSKSAAMYDTLKLYPQISFKEYLWLSKNINKLNDRWKFLLDVYRDVVFCDLSYIRIVQADDLRQSKRDGFYVPKKFNGKTFLRYARNVEVDDCGNVTYKPYIPQRPEIKEAEVKQILRDIGLDDI